MRNRISKLALSLTILVAACDVPPEQEQTSQPVEPPTPIDSSKAWEHHGVIGLADDVDVATLVAKQQESRARLMAMAPAEKDVEAIRQGLTCAWYWPPPINGCAQYVPDPLPGFLTVSPSYVPANGELMMCDNSGSFCQKVAMGPGGFYNIGNLGDWSATGMFPFKSVNTKMNGNQSVYSGFNFSGSSWGWTGNRNFTNVPGMVGYHPSSFGISN